MRAARVSIFVNILLSAFKLAAGILGNSAAMISDAVHSITDLISTVVVIIGIRLSGKAADKDHPYGHERFECIATLVLVALVTYVGVGIGWSGLQTVWEAFSARGTGEFYLPIPGLIALIAAAISIVVKEGLFWYVRAAARKIDSQALMADAWHSRADGLSSIGSFIGIGGAMLGFPIMDAVAALIICLFIFKTAFQIAIDAINKLTDKAADDETQEAMRTVITTHPQVQGIDRLDTRLFGNKIFVEADIQLEGTLLLSEAHAIAEEVHDQIEAAFPKVKHCMVHVNPARPPGEPHEPSEA